MSFLLGHACNPFVFVDFTIPIVSQFKTVLCTTIHGSPIGAPCRVNGQGQDFSPPPPFQLNPPPHLTPHGVWACQGGVNEGGGEGW